MLVGVSRALKAAGSKARIVALEPSTSPFLTTGKGGAHRVEGTAAGFWPPHLTKDFYDEVRVIDENDGRAMARRAAKEEGVFAGTSSGVNLVAAIALARELGPGQSRRDRGGRHRPQVPRRRPVQVNEPWRRERGFTQTGSARTRRTFTLICRSRQVD